MFDLHDFTHEVLLLFTFHCAQIIGLQENCHIVQINLKVEALFVSLDLYLMTVANPNIQATPFPSLMCKLKCVITLFFRSF